MFLSFLVIDHVEIFLVNILGQNQKDFYLEDFRNVRNFLNFLIFFFFQELIFTRFLNANGKNLILETTHKILLEVYDLVSTTISGIPMKV